MADDDGDLTFQGNVASLEFDEDTGSCSAALGDSETSVTVTTIEPRMQSLLETAFAKSLPATITYLAGSNELRSVKIVAEVNL